MQLKFFCKMRDGNVMALVTAKTNGGEPFYAFLKLPPDNYKHLEQRVSTGPVPLAECGEVLFYDYATSPPPDVLEGMRELYLN